MTGRPGRHSRGWRWVVVIGATVAAVAWGGVVWWDAGAPGRRQRVVDGCLADLTAAGMLHPAGDPMHVRSADGTRIQGRRFTAPSAGRLEEARQRLRQAAGASGARVRGGGGPGGSRLDLVLGPSLVYRIELVTAPAVAPTRPPARLALLIDDMGYTRSQFAQIAAVDRPLTLAILPHRRYSGEAAQLAQEEQCEVMLHLPLEPWSATTPREPGTITTAMPSRDVIRRFRDAVESVPGIVGVNNHMGSRATEDPALMRTVLTQVRRAGLFFVDSVVTDQSVCETIAREVGVPFAKRAVFLDNVDTVEAVEQELGRLAEAAIRHGQAIGIGHDRPATLTAIRRMLPALERRGIQVVPASALVGVVGEAGARVVQAEE